MGLFARFLHAAVPSPSRGNDQYIVAIVKPRVLLLVSELTMASRSAVSETPLPETSSVSTVPVTMLMKLVKQNVATLPLSCIKPLFITDL